MLIACKDNKQIIQESKQKHNEGAKADSIHFENLKKQDEKLNGILLDGRFYTPAQLDSIFTGKR